MPNSRKKVTILCYVISFIIYMAIFLWGIFGEHHGSYFGYGMFSFYLIIPVTSFIISLFLALKNAYLKWLYPFLFGAFGLFIPMMVFPRMFSDVWIFCIVPAFVGYSVGLLFCKARTK